MGRYSIDKPGLIIANSDDELVIENKKLRIESYEEKERHEIDNPRFIPDTFGVIPVTGERVFENDIVIKIEKFVSAFYGPETLNENLEFIGTHLGIKTGESPREAIKRYFIKDFYTDHLQRYKKRPIYWMVNSGKKEGFSALIYMHRYRDNTIGRIRADYLNRYQEVLENILDSNSRRLLLSFSKKIYSERFPLEYKFSRDVIKFFKKKVSLYIEIPLQKWYHMILKVIYL